MNPYDNATTYTKQIAERTTARQAAVAREAYDEDHMGYFLDTDKPGRVDQWGYWTKESTW